MYLPQREFIEATAQAARHDEQQKQIEENARRKIIQEASADGCRFLTDNEKQLRLSYRKQEHKEECQKNPSLAYRLSCEVAYIKSFYEIEVLKELDGIMLCADGSELTVSL